MTTTYSPDLAPDLEPPVVRWQPRHPTQDQRELQLRIAVTLGAAAFGALAVGAVAIGVLAVRRLGVGHGRFRALEIGDLRVGRLRRMRRPF